MKLKLTEKGVSLTPIMILVMVAAIYTRDLILWASLASILALFIGDAVHILIRGKEKCSYTLSGSGSGEALESSALTWERQEIRVRIVGCSSIESIEASEWLKTVSLRRLGELEYEAILAAFFRSPGIYRVSEIYLERRGFLGLFKLRQALRMSISYKVLPEAVHWILYGLEILGIGAQAFIATYHPRDVSSQVFQSLLKRASSGEYLLSREYSPGDTPRRIDWKATGRRGRLVVKEFGEDLENGVSLVVDYRCIGFYTCDSIASSAISLAVFLTENRIPVDLVYEVDSNRVYRFRDPASLLAYVIDNVLERKLVDPDLISLHEYSSPLDINSIRELLRRISGADLEPPALGGAEGENPLELFSGSRAGEQEVVLISMLIHSVDRVIDMASTLKSLGSRLSIIAPEKPWLDSRDLEEAYRIYSTMDLAIKRLRDMGANIVLWSRRWGESGG